MYSGIWLYVTIIMQKILSVNIAMETEENENIARFIFWNILW